MKKLCSYLLLETSNKTEILIFCLAWKHTTRYQDIGNMQRRLEFGANGKHVQHKQKKKDIEQQRERERTI